MATLKFIVWGSAGDGNVNELPSSVVGPFGSERADEAKRKAKAMAKACKAHCDEQGEIVDLNGYEWDGTFSWDVATLRLPEGLEWDGVDPLGALKADCGKYAEADPDFLEEFIGRCKFDVVMGCRSEMGSSSDSSDYNEFAEEALWRALRPGATSWWPGW